MSSATSVSTPTASNLQRAVVDPAWRRLYRIGGVCAWLYILLALAVPAVMTVVVEDFWGDLVDAPALLALIAENRVYWHVLQALVLETSVFTIIAFVALYVALQHVDRALAAVGAIVSITTQLLFMAYYPVLLGLAYLAEQYAEAAPSRQAELAIAADALIAQNSGFNPVYEALMGVGILFFALVMLKGVFPRWMAYLGFATFVASIVGVSLYPVIGLAYFFWWAFFVIWFPAVGWKLWQLGRPAPAAESPADN